MNHSSNANAQGSLTLRQTLWYKAQVIAIALLVLGGMGRGYTIKVEQDQEALRAKAAEIDLRLSDCLKKHLIDEQQTACKQLADEAAQTSMESTTSANSFPNRQLLNLLGSKDVRK